MLIHLVDANSIGYAGQAATELSSGDQPTQAIYNALMGLRNLKSKSPHSDFIYLWDTKAQFRYDLLPTYKAGRNITPEQKKAKTEYHSQQPFIKKMLTHLGVKQCSHNGFEADDIAFHLSKVLLAKGYDIKLVSSDKDWLQMLTKPNITWYDPRLERSCTQANFEEIAKAKSVQEFIARKCIIGDKSDAIDGISGLGEKACEHIFNKWPSVVAMVKAHRELGVFTKENTGPEFGRYLKKMNAFCGNEEGLLRRYQTNLELMDLSKAPAITGLQFVKGKKDQEAFFELCGELAFASVTRKKEIWSNLFFASKKEVA